VHIAAACAGCGEGSDHFGPYVQSFSVFLQEAAQGVGKGPTTLGLMYVVFHCISARGYF
jgi:hypothetical protein